MRMRANLDHLILVEACDSIHVVVVHLDPRLCLLLCVICSLHPQTSVFAPDEGKRLDFTGRTAC